MSIPAISQTTLRALPKKSIRFGKSSLNTGSAGALARTEREARNGRSVKGFEIERAAHALRARAPALPALVCRFLAAHHFFGQGYPFPHRVYLVTLPILWERLQCLPSPLP